MLVAVSEPTSRSLQTYIKEKKNGKNKKKKKGVRESGFLLIDTVCSIRPWQHKSQKKKKKRKTNWGKSPHNAAYLSYSKQQAIRRL